LNINDKSCAKLAVKGQMAKVLEIMLRVLKLQPYDKRPDHLRTAKK
jgi:hypothetical protein